MLINHPIEEYGPLRGKYSQEWERNPWDSYRSHKEFLCVRITAKYECMFSVM